MPTNSRLRIGTHPYCPGNGPPRLGSANPAKSSCLRPLTFGGSRVAELDLLGGSTTFPTCLGNEGECASRGRSFRSNSSGWLPTTSGATPARRSVAGRYACPRRPASPPLRSASSTRARPMPRLAPVIRIVFCEMFGCSPVRGSVRVPEVRLPPALRLAAGTRV